MFDTTGVLHRDSSVLKPFISQWERIWPSSLEAISGARFPVTIVDRAPGVAESPTELAVCAISTSRGIRFHGP